MLAIEKVKLPKAPGPTKATLKKLEALGSVGDAPRSWKPLWSAMALPVGDQWVGIVEADGESRAALLGKKDKAARFVEGVPAGSPVMLDVTEAGAAYVSTFVGDDWTIFALDVARGAVERVYAGPRVDLHPAAGGLLVARDEDAIVLVAPDGAAGRVVGRCEVAPAQDDVGVCPGGTVVVAFRDGPEEAVLLGVYPGEAEPLRPIGALPHSAGGYAFLTVEGRCLFRALGNTYELTGFVEAYEAGRAGAVADASPTHASLRSAGGLAFAFTDPHVLYPPDRVVQLRALDFERDDIVPCAGGHAGAWVTRLDYGRKRSAIALVDGETLEVRTLELPPGKYQPLEVDASGTRARTWADPKDVLEVSLPGLELRHAGAAEDPAAIVARAGIARPGDAKATLDGKVIAACCSTADDGEAIAVVGIYGDAVRLIGRLDPPPGIFHGWKRRGERLYAWANEFWELTGVAEAYARGAEGPGLPLGDLRAAKA
jgi:hypothetical protein